MGAHKRGKRYAHTMNLKGPEFDAILAGLRLLQGALDSGEVVPGDGEIGGILSGWGGCDGLSCDEIDVLCEEMNSGERDA